MNELIRRLTDAMIVYDAGDPARIHHFLKVHAFAAEIGRGERLDEYTQFILEAAALVHDIGIHLAEETYGDCSGKYQELAGPGEAETMLKALGFGQDVIQRVCYLVGHHHTFEPVDGLDHRILLEADFLVNLYEDSISPEGQRQAYEHIFRTETGKRLCRLLYPASEG